MKTLLTTIYHPQTTELALNIYQEGDNFFFEENGDWYNTDWCEFPLEECIEDAEARLDSIYRGTFYTPSVCEEQRVFSAMGVR